jgi:hypothetical protein
MKWCEVLKEIKSIENTEATTEKMTEIEQTTEPEFIFYDKECEQCSICWDVFNETNAITQLICGHAFHTKCIIDSVSKLGNNCPKCRSVIMKEKCCVTIVEDDDEEEDEEEYTYGLPDSSIKLFRHGYRHHPALNKHREMHIYERHNKAFVELNNEYVLRGYRMFYDQLDYFNSFGRFRYGNVKVDKNEKLFEKFDKFKPNRRRENELKDGLRRKSNELNDIKFKFKIVVVCLTLALLYIVY